LGQLSKFSFAFGFREIPSYKKKVRLSSFLIYRQVARRIFAKTKARNPIFLGFIDLIVKGQNQISQNQ